LAKIVYHLLANKIGEKEYIYLYFFDSERQSLLPTYP